MAFTDREERLIKQALLQIGTTIEWLVQRTEGMTEQDNEHAAQMLEDLRRTVGAVRVHNDPTRTKETTP